MTEFDPELVALFREETHERISRIFVLLGDMRGGDGAIESQIEELNRELHTIKGSVKMLGFHRFGTFVHELENLTPALVNDVSGAVLELFEECADEIAGLTDACVSDGEDRSPRQLLAKLRAALEGEGPGQGAGAPDGAGADSDTARPAFPDPSAAVGGASHSSSEIRWPGGKGGSEDEVGERSGIIVDSGMYDIRAFRKEQDEQDATGGSATKASPEAPARPRRGRSTRRRGGVEELVRVRGSKLASLDTLVSDLIDSRLRLDHHEQSLKEILKEAETDDLPRHVVSALYRQFCEDRRHLNLVAKGLEQLAVDLRLRPIARIFDHVARTGRDLARSSGKKVRIEVSGETTELDRVILDGIRDPLGHIIRNVVDHGIEMPDARVAAGKNPKGRIELSAFQDGVAVVVRITDDGAGVDTVRLRRVVVERGLLTAEQVSEMPEKEVIDLVFIPGLSTRLTTTETSGRGVGMDVVRRNVEALKGEVRIESERGRGTVIELRVPLTLLVSRVMLVQAGDVDQSYALPTEALEGTESVAESELVEYGGQTVYKVRDRFVPVVPLAELLGLEPDESPAQRRLAIVRHKEDYLALEIHEIIGERSVVIKPLGWPLVNVPAISGAILLGSGELALTIHVPDLIEIFASRRSNARGRLKTRRLVESPSPAVSGRRTILFVDDSKIYRNLARSTLESLGYQVIIANDGLEAWQRLPSLNVDLVLTDFEMPRLDGLELTRRIKKSSALGSLPVVMISTRAETADLERGFAAGADAYLNKADWDDSLLDATLRRFI